MIKRCALLLVMLATIGQAAQATFEKYNTLQFDFDEADVGLLEPNDATAAMSEPEVPASGNNTNSVKDLNLDLGAQRLDLSAQRLNTSDTSSETCSVFDTDAFFTDTVSTKQFCFDKPHVAKEKDEKDKHFDVKKPVVKPVLFIKGNGTVCKDFQAKGNVCVKGGLRFNRKGCHKLWAKGTKEKNLLNLRGVLHFDCNPFLRLSRTTECGSDEGQTEFPAVGCLADDLTCTLGNGTVRVNSGCGFKDACAKISCSGTACMSREISGSCVDISLVTTVTIELCIPLCLCVPFCDCPAVIVSHEDRALCSRSICLNAGDIGLDCTPFLATRQENGCDGTISNIPTADPIGNHVLTYLGSEVSLKSVSKKIIGIKLRLTYQHCIGHINSPSEALALDETAFQADERACCLQQEAVKQMGEDANKRLRDITISVLAEGRVL